MKFTPRKVTYLISRLVIALSAVFTAMNVLFIYLSEPRMMPLALSMTGYLSKTGMLLTADRGYPFFAIYSLALSGIVCVVFLLSALLSGINRGWLVTGALIFLADCVGVALLIINNGYRSGYWFEIAGHAVLLIALIVAFCTMPRKNKAAAE